MEHCLGLLDLPADEISAVVAQAREMKAGRADAAGLKNRILGMVFFNPSLRTRVSFEAAMLRGGGHAVALNVGGDAWRIEHRDGVTMDAEAAEHVREAAPVLSRYCDVLGIRTFARMEDAGHDAADALLRSFARFATVPVVSLESAFEHPCQGLADRVTMEDKLEDARGRRFTLTWAPHVKPLPMAVPNSAVLAAASAGMHVTIAHPPGYELNTSVLDRAREWCHAAGATLTGTQDQAHACEGADVVYVKSWGAPGMYGDAAAQRESFREHAGWTVTPTHLGAEAILMHCLPVRRNVVIADAALDGPHSVIVDQAENRMWAQAALLDRLLKR